MSEGSRASYPPEAWLSDGSFGEGKARLTKAPRRQLLESRCEPSQDGGELSKRLSNWLVATADDVATEVAGPRCALDR